MNRLTRGQVIALVFIAFVFCLMAFVFDKVVSYNADKDMYLKYDEDKSDILLNGDYVSYVNLGDDYVELGLDTNLDYEISYFFNDTVVSGINTLDFGVYTVKYYLSDGAFVTRVVMVVDNEAPSISVPDKQTITSAQAMVFDLEDGVVATDNSGNVSLSFDDVLSTVPGDYVITYVAYDNSGNKTQRKRLIKVESGIVFEYDSGVLNISYPKGDGYTYKYSLDGGDTFLNASSLVEIDDPLNVIAVVFEGDNYVMSNSFSLGE